MSTEHHKYSTEIQAEIIEAYAARRGFQVVRTCRDAGKSDLRLDGRVSLQQLIADVQEGQTDFYVILVYDVSRWARHQDAGESAYHEFICRKAERQRLQRRLCDHRGVLRLRHQVTE